MTRLRSLLYSLARLLGDVSALKHHRIWRRIKNRIVGRAAGRIIGKVLR